MHILSALAIIFILLGSAMVLASPSGKIRFYCDDVYPCDEFIIHANVRNDKHTEKVYALDDNNNPIPRNYKKVIKKDKLEDVKVKAYIPDLGVQMSSHKADLDSGEKSTRYLIGQIPRYTPKGEYLIRIVTYSDKERDVSHRYINII